MTADVRDRGRESFARKAWAEAYTQLSAADRESPLGPEDLERLATAAYLLGRDADWVDTWARAHREHLSRGDPERAARCAFWLGSSLLERGETARANGWIVRGQRLLADCGRDCVEHGYLRFPAALDALAEGDNSTGYTIFSQMAEIGQRFDDRDLITLARHGQGRALIRLGETTGGIALLDEVMVAVTSGEVSPIVVGDVYCGMISACQEIFDIRRARQWTTALTDWCATQPDLVAYRGQCMIRRAEIMQFHGAWPVAMDEARRACERLSQPPGQPGAGAAYYQLAELHRLRGEFAPAEEAYSQASDRGRNPQPGMALLRLAQGQMDAARSAIVRAADQARERRSRSRVLGPYVEIMIAANELPAARAAADELVAIAGAAGAPLLHAMSNQAMGAVLMVERQVDAALAAWGRALTTWCELDAPYETARVRVMIGVACREQGDDAGGRMELEAARRVFHRLGAAPDLARLAELSRPSEPGRAARLTSRELQVLREVAAGKTNRAIARDLAISEKTVARHLSNIFTKLELTTRAAATAYAYQHHLVQ